MFRPWTITCAFLKDSYIFNMLLIQKYDPDKHCYGQARQGVEQINQGVWMPSPEMQLSGTAVPILLLAAWFLWEA